MCLAWIIKRGFMSGIVPSVAVLQQAPNAQFCLRNSPSLKDISQ